MTHRTMDYVTKDEWAERCFYAEEQIEGLLDISISMVEELERLEEIIEDLTGRRFNEEEWG